MNVPPAHIDAHAPLAGLGLDSLAAVEFAQSLEDWLGLSIPATILWDYPTLEVLSRDLAEDQ